MVSGSYFFVIDVIVVDGSRISISSSFNVVGEDFILLIVSVILL